MITPDARDRLIRAGQLAATAHEAIGRLIKPGLNILAIEKLATELIAKGGLQPAFLGYKGYPAVTCISVNDEIVHGIPRSYVLKEGDVVAVDLGVADGPYLVDTAWTHPVGQVSPEKQRLLATTHLALERAIGVCRIGGHINDVGRVVEPLVTKAGFAVVEELNGHGVGPTLQERPTIPNYRTPNRGVPIEAGMVLAIEPITSILPTDVETDDDGWTIRAKNGTVSAHFEHTILVTDGDPLVLTVNRLRAPSDHPSILPDGSK